MGKDSGAGSSQEIKVDEEEELGRALLSSYSGEEESLEGRGESSVLIPCETLTIIDFFKLPFPPGTWPQQALAHTSATHTSRQNKSSAVGVERSCPPFGSVLRSFRS